MLALEKSAEKWTF